MVFGRLTVIKRMPSNEEGKSMWLCQCSCGKQIVANGYILKTGSHKSCGCGRKHINRTHGMTKSVQYALYMGAKFRAKQANVDFKLDLEDVVVPEYCPLLGIKLERGKKYMHSNSPSVDRIDPSKGYIKGNIWIISYRANAIKQNATLAELKMLTNNLEAKVGLSI
jgi:hypothetical protein